MFDKASKKLGLDKAVLQSMGTNKEAGVANVRYHYHLMLLHACGVSCVCLSLHSKSGVII